MAEEHASIWRRIDENHQRIIDLELRHERLDAEMAVKLEQFERNQLQQMQALSRIEALTITNSTQLATASGGVKFFRWLGGFTVAVVSAYILVMSYLRGG